MKSAGDRSSLTLDPPIETLGGDFLELSDIAVMHHHLSSDACYASLYAFERNSGALSLYKKLDFKGFKRNMPCH